MTKLRSNTSVRLSVDPELETTRVSNSMKAKKFADSALKFTMERYSDSLSEQTDGQLALLRWKIRYKVNGPTRMSNKAKKSLASMDGQESTSKPSALPSKVLESSLCQENKAKYAKTEKLK